MIRLAIFLCTLRLLRVPPLRIYWPGQLASPHAPLFLARFLGSAVHGNWSQLFMLPYAIHSNMRRMLSFCSHRLHQKITASRFLSRPFRIASALLSGNPNQSQCPSSLQLLRQSEYQCQHFSLCGLFHALFGGCRILATRSTRTSPFLHDGRSTGRVIPFSSL